MDYQGHYDRLIARALARTPDAYTERHHIIPSCVGGSDQRSNLVDLYPDEHLFAHRVLCRIYPHVPSLAYAVAAMSRGQRGKLHRKIYAMDRARVSVANSHRQRGTVLSEAHKQKISAATKGRVNKRFPCTNKQREMLSMKQSAYMSSVEVRERTRQKMLLIKANPCTIDGIKWYHSLSAVEKQLGAGKRGLRHPNLRLATPDERETYLAKFRQSEAHTSSYA